MNRIFLLFLFCSIPLVSKAQVDSVVNISLLELPYIDDGFPNLTNNSGEADYEKYDQNKYKLFIQYVYTPAISNKNLSAGNLQLLNNLKNYLECSNPRDASICGVDILPIWPVYEFGYITGQDNEGADIYQRYVSIFTEFPFYQNGYSTNVDDHWLHHGLMKKKMFVVYSNWNKTAAYTIKKFDDFKTACYQMRTFILHKTDTTDFRKPAFCTPYELDLVYRSDTIMNRILYDYNDWDNSGSYCDPSQHQVSFAQLKGVPFLYFTTDADPGDWFTYYPTRGIYLKLSNKMIVKLFDFRVEMVECSCI